LQRLFPMFPYGWPGRGLLLLRLGVVAILTPDGIRAWMGAPQRESIALQVVAAVTGVFLLVGLWTPVAGAIVASSEIWIVLTGTAHPHFWDRARCPSRPPVWQKASQSPCSRVLSVTPAKRGWNSPLWGVCARTPFEVARTAEVVPHSNSNVGGFNFSAVEDFNSGQ
jgi:hypothetical protein